MILKKRFKRKKSGNSRIRATFESRRLRRLLFLLIPVTAWMILLAAKNSAADDSMIHAVFSYWNSFPEETQDAKVYEGGLLWCLFHQDTSESITDGVPSTSTDYRFDFAFSKTLLEYTRFRELYRADYSTALPGLQNTNLGTSDSDQMVPQGLCIAGDYMLITAYDKSKKENSVLYVLSNEDAANRQLLLTIVLPDQNHVGGITFDGSMIWIAKSTTKYISGISYERLEELVESGGEVCVLEEYDENIYCGVTASFIGFQDERLWIGTSHSFLTKQGALTVFRISGEDDSICLVRQFSMDIPNNAQGITFFNWDGRQYLLLATSQGRFRDSALYVYEEFINEEEVLLRGMWRYTMPPMIEELASDDQYTYCLFESAATCYSTVDGLRCKYPVDRVCALRNQGLIEN